MDDNFNEPRFVLVDGRDEAIYQRIHQEIKAFNDKASDYHRRLRATGPEPLDRVVIDARGNVVGGLMAQTYWDWLELDQLWLDESVRGLGYGRRLVLEAESDARERGCGRAWVRTFSFQARGFYERIGYRIVGQLEDYPPGFTFYWMQKDIA